MTKPEIIYAYSRKQALQDGEQILINNYFPKICSYFYKYTVYITRVIWEEIIQLAETNIQSIENSINDILFMSINNSSRFKTSQNRVEFKLYLPFTEEEWKIKHLIAECGPEDIDNSLPCITIITPFDL